MRWCYLGIASNFSCVILSFPLPLSYSQLRSRSRTRHRPSSFTTLVSTRVVSKSRPLGKRSPGCRRRRRDNMRRHTRRMTRLRVLRRRRVRWAMPRRRAIPMVSLIVAATRALLRRRSSSSLIPEVLVAGMCLLVVVRPLSLRDRRAVGPWLGSVRVPRWVPSSGLLRGLRG